MRSRFNNWKKTFRDRVVITITPPTQTGPQSVATQEGLPVGTRVLTALITVNYGRRLRLTPPHRHQEGLQHEASRHLRLHRPANDAPRIQIQHDRQVVNRP